MRPSSRAASNPALVRSLSIALSNSAKAPTICIIIRPAGVVVSMASVRLRNPALASASRSMIISTSRRDRDSRSRFPHYEHVTFAELIEKSEQFRPVPPSAGGLFFIYALSPGGFKRTHLDGGAPDRQSRLRRSRSALLK